MSDASLQAGISEAVIRKHYLDLKSVEEADVFWSIVPKGAALSVLEKKEGRYVVPADSLLKVSRDWLSLDGKISPNCMC